MIDVPFANTKLNATNPIVFIAIINVFGTNTTVFVTNTTMFVANTTVFVANTIIFVIFTIVKSTKSMMRQNDTIVAEIASHFSGTETIASATSSGRNAVVYVSEKIQAGCK